MKVSVFSILNVLLLSVFLGLFVSCKGQDISSASPMEKEEQEALYSAIQGFVGSWWNGSDLYPDPCGWTPIQGVSCDFHGGFWYVTELKIGQFDDNSLHCSPKAEFTDHLYKLKHLRSLSFTNCFLSRQQNPVEIPTSKWENLAESLAALEFRSNPGLVGPIPTSIGQLREIRSLVLVENGFTGELPAELGNLLKLNELVLSGNQFAGRVTESLGRLTQLLILDASRNNLSGSLPSAMGGLTSLLKLDLSNNSLDGELPRELGTLKNLTLLDLGSNRFSGGLKQHPLEEMAALVEMVLSNNPIGGELQNIQWGNLQNLEILELSNMGLRGEVPESMAVLRKLRFLGLNDNYLAGKPSPVLESLPCLSTLYLNGNNLTGKLEFSELFYTRMGRRLGLWSNPNLCFGAELNSTSHFPFGVTACLEEPKAPGRTASAEMVSEDPKSFSSSGSSSRDEVDGLCRAQILLWVLLGFIWSSCSC